jgi:hypothetical protein
VHGLAAGSPAIKGESGSLFLECTRDITISPEDLAEMECLSSKKNANALICFQM